MIPFFLVHLPGHTAFLNIFRYITFRAGGAIMTALIIAFFLGPYMIDWLRLRQLRKEGKAGEVVATPY